MAFPIQILVPSLFIVELCGCYQMKAATDAGEEAPDHVVDGLLDEATALDHDPYVDGGEIHDLPADNESQAGDTEVDDMLMHEAEEPACALPCTIHEDCDDANVCTEDLCNPAEHCCIFFSDGLDYINCGDDLYCNGADYCIDGVCWHGDFECGGDTDCARAVCDEELDMCVVEPFSDGTSCDDGLYCTGEDNVCMSGTCRYADPCAGSTGNPCTYYECFEIEPHCVEREQPDGASCEDGDICNGMELCRGGACSAVVPACFDTDPCTEDVCMPETSACENPPIPGCSDCTGDPTCSDGDRDTTDYCRIVDGEIECESVFDPLPH